jgi:hypothetical protein
MISPIWEFSPIAGKISPIATISRKIATTASSWGNICTTRSVVRPTRRPVNRMREKEYAASAPRNTVPAAVTSPITSVLTNHAP